MLDAFHKISQQNHFVSSPVPLALPDNAQWIMAKNTHHDHFFFHILQIIQVFYSDKNSISVSEPKFWYFTKTSSIL